MTLEFGVRFPRPLAGCIGVSGYAYDPGLILDEHDSAANHGNWLITHGTQDEVLPVMRTREQMEQLNRGGFRTDYREFEKNHTIDFQTELPEIRAWMRSRCGESISAGQ